MNTLNFTHDAGFPLDVATLGYMQEAYRIFNNLGYLAGNFVIISGCEKTGNSVSNGIVFVNGEVLPFKGGTEGASVFIKEDITEGTFEDGFLREMEQTRYVTFGISSPEKTFEWANFKKVKNNAQLDDDKTEKTTTNELLKRIEKLEKQKSAIPIGMIALWGKPASEPIPVGWREYVNLRGRMPVGYDPDYNKTANEPEDYKLNRMLEKGGERSHQLTIAEMPRHKHNFKGRVTQDDSGQGSDGHEYSTGGGYLDVISEEGGDKHHNNMPPYRVIQFIEYVGFD
ncbi:phage baseplate protein [Capnocytophaga canimorsus]|uniref:phage baseplate protein n=1 Tax=Capnocytophaga canimorsus TaxID=28188 RepID=UPI0037D2C014